MPKHFGHHLRELRHSRRQESSVYPESVQEIRRSLYWILEEPDASSDVPRVLTVGVACFNVLMILLSLVSLILETSPEFKKTTSEDMRQTIEILTTGCFTVEYLMRLWVCDVYGSSAVDWFFKPLNVCDLLAIIPVYAEFVVRQWDLEFLRVLRVVRLFKIGRYSEGVRVMNAALFNSLSALYILVFLFVIGSIIFASIIYFTEKLSCPDFSSMNLTQFQGYNDECVATTQGISETYGTCCIFMCDIPDGLSDFPLCRPWLEDSTITFGRRMAVEWKVEALNDAEIDSVLTGMWWAAVTMTTVGYGDIVPKHWSSVVVAGFAMVTGILIIAMPFAIVGTKFSEAAGDCFEYESEDEDFAKQLLTQPTSAISEEMKITPDVSASTEPAPETAVLLEKLRLQVDEALAVKKEILQLQVLRDNLWTSVEHSLARLAFEGCISLNAHMVDGPWFNRRVTKKAKTTVENAVARKSLGFIRREWCIRRTAIDITSSWIFESTVLFLIVANSFALAVQNFYYDQENHWGNVLMRETEIVFTLFFTLECAIKIVAYGFVGHPSAYIRDPWNWIDFLVVVVGLLDAMQFEALSFLKPARVLRPLRSLTAVPGIRNLFHTIILSLPGLKDVVLLAIFLLIMFGVLGLHFWSGILHRSCRLTEQPLHFSPQANCSGWCFDNASLVNVSLSSSIVQIDSSLVFDTYCRTNKNCLSNWESGRDYYVWPLDDSQERFCGEYVCRARDMSSGSELQVLQLLGSAAEDSTQVNTVCGSPLASDAEYGPEVVNTELKGVNLDDWNFEVQGSSRNWGITHFDNVAASFLVVFQSVTLEGWSDVMGMVQDAHSTVVGFIYFLLLIVIGSFFLVNVILAIIWDVFLNVREQQLEQEREEAAEAQHVGTTEITLKNATRPDGGLRGRSGAFKNLFDQLFWHRNRTEVEEVLREASDYKAVRLARAIATNTFFKSGVMIMILVNVVVLAMDRYPEHLVEASVGDVLNFIFNIVFLLECIILHVAVGPLIYWSDNAMAFDGLIVLLSVVDLVNDFASGSDGGGSAITALRAFRMLRIFKLAKKFPSMKILLSAGVQTLMSMGDFVALLFLIICVFALMAQSFFGGTFMFDPEDGSLVAPEDYRTKCPMGDGDKPICVPRSHFDTFLWSFITIFQILTGENWNTVMYDGMRATGWLATLFFLFVVLFGNFVILNLFLAILMSSFDEQRGKLHDAMESKRELTRATYTEQRWAWESGAVPIIPGHGPQAVTPRSVVSRVTTRFTDRLPSWISKMELWGNRKNEACTKRCGERSCFLFSREGEIRKACLALIAIPAFDHVIMVFIGFSSVVMAFENPLRDPNSMEVQVLQILGTVFTVIFLLEVVVKVVALGAFCNYGDGRKAYLRSFENVLDFVIVIVSVLDSIQTRFLENSGGGVIAVMRIFRVVRMLRPLRLISRSKNLKVVVKTILAAIPELRNLLVFSSLFFLIFGLLAVGNLKGSYHSCKDNTLEDYSFTRTPEITPMCIGETAISGSSETLKTMTQQASGVCPTGWETWQRSSRDTPICEVHCEASSHASCQTSPWGYQVMRCTDCSVAHCPDEDQSRRESCESRCSRHEYFCKAGGTECLEQCVAACLCETSCYGLIEDAALCTEQGGKWVNLNQNFDNLLVGTIALFEISTTEGWVDVMLAAVDSRGPYLQPKRDANEFIGSMLFVAFMLIGSFFVLNLCVGVIIDNYNKQKKESDIHFVLVTDVQAAWMTQMKAIYLRRTFFSQVNVDRLGPSRQHRFRIITSSAFENLIMACIVIQLCLLLLVWQPRDPGGSFETFLNSCNVFFIVVFHIECFVKLSALYCNYFREYWNVFDFICVITSDIVSILEASIAGDATVNLSSLVNALRIFRIARLFRVVRVLKGLNKLLLAFALSVPKLFNVGLVMLLLLYLYSVLGVSLFAKVAYTGVGLYGPQANFRTFFQAFSMLIRSMTGEGWNFIMHDLSLSKWYYESILETTCGEMNLETLDFATLDFNKDGFVDHPTECGTGFSFLYFISYTVLVSFIFLNLFIAVIFEGFEESRGSEPMEVITKCLENWERYDPFNTMYIPLSKALDFIDETVEELMNAKQPQKGQCLPEPRWDSRSTIDMNASDAMWSMYNLQYVRTLGLRVRSDGQVRLVQAFKAVMRRLVISGGPYSIYLPQHERRQRVKEIELLETMMLNATEDIEPDMTEILALEARQEKQIQQALGPSASPARVLTSTSKTSGGYAHDELEEFDMLQKVAAAKIQRRSKESFQRRRDRAGGSAIGHHGPITRAAG